MPAYSILFAIPLLVAYEILALALDGSELVKVRNGADILLKNFFGVVGFTNTYLIGGLLIVLLLAVALWNWRRESISFQSGYLALMFGESLVYALGFGYVVSSIVRVILVAGGNGFTIPARVVLSLGAGFYEELVFRVILVSGIFAVMTRGFSMRRTPALATSAVISSLLFSGFHYVGAYGEQFTPETFAFRWVAGMILSGLYIFRGFGITAYTHALYDLFFILP